MPYQPLPKFTATPDGILFNDLLLTKGAFSNLPQQSLRYVERAHELLAKVEKEDWDDRTPHDGNHVPVLAQVNMMLALAMPQFLDKRGYNQDEQRVPKGNGRESGRWTSTDGVTEADLKNPRFRGMTRIQIKKQKFVDTHLAAAEKGAKQLNVPVENLLALSAVESGWGIDSRFARDGNNFFGLHYPSPFMSGAPMHARENGAPVARFASYEDSMRSFIVSQGYIVRNISDATAFAEALQNSRKFGIIPSNGSKVPTYVSETVGTVKRLPPYIVRTR